MSIIRRKVFSQVNDEFVPVNEVFSENLYSVVMSEEEIRAFSEYCECLFSEEEEKKSKHTSAKVAAGVTGGAALTTGGIIGADKLGKHLEKRSGLVHSKEWIGNAEEKLGKALQKPAREIEDILRNSKTSHRVRGYMDAAAQKAEELSYIGKEMDGKAAQNTKKAMSSDTLRKTIKKIKKH